MLLTILRKYQFLAYNEEFSVYFIEAYYSICMFDSMFIYMFSKSFVLLTPLESTDTKNFLTCSKYTILFLVFYSKEETLWIIRIKPSSCSENSPKTHNPQPAVVWRRDHLYFSKYIVNGNILKTHSWLNGKYFWPKVLWLSLSVICKETGQIGAVSLKMYCPRFYI